MKKSVNNNYNKDDLIKIMMNKKKSKKFLNNYQITIKNDLFSLPKTNKSQSVSNFFEFLLSYKASFLVISPELRNFIYNYLKHNVINKEQRNLLWIILSNTHYNLSNNQNYYNNLDTEINSNLQNFEELIDVDIKRTNYFKHSDNDREIMKRIMLNFCKRNQKIGYCQGMNKIVEFFYLKGFSEEEIFWIICYILENVMDYNYFTNMVSAMFDTKVFSKIIESKLKKLYNHSDNLQAEFTYTILPCFIMMFLNVEDEVFKDIIIDFLMIKGPVYLIKAGYYILKNYEKVLLQQNNISNYLSKFEEIITITLQIKNELKFKQDLTSLYINSKVYYYLTYSGYKYLNKKNKNVNLSSSKKYKQCQELSPYCFINENKFIKENYFIFKRKNILSNFQPDYLLSNKKNPKINNEKVIDTITIIREPHICELKSYLIRV